MILASGCCSKCSASCGLEPADLRGHLDDDRDQRGDGRAHRVRDDARAPRAAVPATRSGSRSRVRRCVVGGPHDATPTRSSTGTGPCPSVGVGAIANTASASFEPSSSNASSAAGIELPQRRAQLVELSLPRPDHRLMRPGEDLHRFGEIAVTRDRPMVVTVECGRARRAPTRHPGRTSRPRSSAAPDNATSTSGSPPTPDSRPRPTHRRTTRGRSRSRSPHRPDRPTCSATSAWNRATPSTPSGNRARASRRPCSSSTCTS